MFNVKLAKRRGGLGITISCKYPVSYALSSWSGIVIYYYVSISLMHTSRVIDKVIYKHPSIVFASVPPNRKPGDPLVISEVRKGSVAHR